jgi:hypothetical protein
MLFIVLDDDTPQEKLHWRARWEARRSYHRAVDIIPCGASVFAVRAQIVGSLANTIAREGVVVYERP